MTSARYGSLPFKEQLEFFRQKTNIPTASWVDVYAQQHDLGFMVAGARGQVLTDFRALIDKQLAEGITLHQFRQQFDELVQRTGWAYNGGRNWRTRVIYETNLRQSYHAGREAQMADPELRQRRPYGLYRHGGSSDPRPEHLAWNGLVLPLDDPWWQTHSPQNGWGCKCKKYTLSEADVQRMGLKVAEHAPAIEWEDRLIGQRGPNPQTVRVPKGIDPGFEYAPGASRYARQLQLALTRTQQLPAALAATETQALLGLSRSTTELRQHWQQWLQGWQNDPVVRGRQFTAGALSGKVVRELGARGIEPVTAAILITDAGIRHILRDVKQDAKTKSGASKGLAAAELAQLPDILAQPQAILWDTKKQNLLYVFPAQENRSGKLTVEVNYVVKTRDEQSQRQKVQVNSVVSGGQVERYNLAGSQYELLEGSLDD